MGIGRMKGMKKTYWAIEDRKGRLKKYDALHADNMPILFHKKLKALEDCSSRNGERPVKVEVRKEEE